MVVITISYSPPQYFQDDYHHHHHHPEPTYNSHHYPNSSCDLTPSSSSTSASPTLFFDPINSTPTLLQVIGDDEDVLATSKQEEWITKKKTELVTTKQIETRVKRQVVLEDGKVIQDSGPQVTTTTTEDTDKNESEQTQHKQHGADPEPGDGWIPIENVPDDAIVKEMNERKVTTHDEVEDVIETEELRHLGDVSSENLVRSIRHGRDRRQVLFDDEIKGPGLIEVSPYDRDSSARRRIINQSRRHDRTTDIEGTKEVSKINEKGNLVTEITKRTEHEDFHNEDIPDSDSDEFEHVEDQEGIREYNHIKDENYMEYLSVPKGGSLSQGVKIWEGPHLVSEIINSERQGDDDLWDSVSERIRSPTSPEVVGRGIMSKIIRSVPSTSRVYNSSQEEHSRKHETNRWLNSHFGSSSSSVNSDQSPSHVSSRHSTPQGIHVTMTSRSPNQISPQPPPLYPRKIRQPIDTVDGNRSFDNNPLSQNPKSPPHKDVRFDLRNRHEDVMRSVNSQFGRSSVSKSGEDLRYGNPTPTPPPRSRRLKSPEMRQYVSSPDHNVSPPPPNRIIMDSHQENRNDDVGIRKSFERREASFGYTGPGRHPLNRDSFESGNFGDGYVSKHNNYYKTNETNNPAQNVHYENEEAEVSERKIVERREQNLTYSGPSQKQFHPKYIVGIPDSTIGRLRGLESSEDSQNHPKYLGQSASLKPVPKARYLYGDDSPRNSQSPHPPLEPRRSGGYGMPKDLRTRDPDDINVSVSNKYGTKNSVPNEVPGKKSSNLSRSMSFSPSTIQDQSARSKRILETVTLETNSSSVLSSAKSNPQLVETADLLSPRLINSLTRPSRDIPVTGSRWVTQNDRITTTDHSNIYSNKYETTNSSSLRKTEKDRTHEPISVLKRSSALTATGPATGPTPSTRPFSPMSRALTTVSSSGGRVQRTTSPGLPTDDYQETYRMTSSTPDTEDGSKPRITTDTTSKFSRQTLRNPDGHLAGKVESSETTTRTKSRFQESGVMYPSTTGRAQRSTDYKPKTTADGSVVIPVRDPNNNGRVHYDN